MGREERSRAEKLVEWHEDGDKVSRLKWDIASPLDHIISSLAAWATLKDLNIPYWDEYK